MDLLTLQVLAVEHPTTYLRTNSGFFWHADCAYRQCMVFGAYPTNRSWVDHLERVPADHDESRDECADPFCVHRVKPWTC